MRTLKLHVIIIITTILSPTLSFAQVGISTTDPTATLDVNGDTRIRNLSNSEGLTAEVYALSDGTLVTAFTSDDALGTKFVGFLPTDISLSSSEVFYDINASDELIDVLSEYDTTTGLYQPATDGYYKIEMNFDIGDYTSSTDDIDILIGFWDYTDNEWVLRRTFKHTSSSFFLGRNESYGISNYILMDRTHTYGFRIYPTYNNASGAPRNARLKFQNTGSTGNSKSTSFSIEKVL